MFLLTPDQNCVVYSYIGTIAKEFSKSDFGFVLDINVYAKTTQKLLNGLG